MQLGSRTVALRTGYLDRRESAKPIRVGADLRGISTTERGGAMTHTLLPTPPVEIVPALREDCDRCGATAKLALELTTGGELAFCGHHANRHAPDILRSAQQIYVLADFSWPAAR
jgi:hypothetical protein